MTGKVAAPELHNSRAVGCMRQKAPSMDLRTSTMALLGINTNEMFWDEAFLPAN